jgi:dienelactone hydrolase
MAACNANAQFLVGNTTASFTDITRSNRQISCEIFYPAIGEGADVPVAEGMFPYIVFGHGFVMNYTAYETLANALVSSGYVLLFVETEGGFAPSHSAYGLDLAYVADHFFADNSSSGAGIFQNHLQDRCGIMGHSMGGGATWLASTTSVSVDCIAGLAPAETNPSAIAAATNATVPAIVFSGSSDAVTAPATNHVPIFEGTASSCKLFVNILEGSHCGYADSGSLCDFGEFGFNGLSREEQQAITHDLLIAYFDYHLKEMWSGNEVLQSYESQQTNAEIQINCLVNVQEAPAINVSAFPNPCTDQLCICANMSELAPYELIDIAGRMVRRGQLAFNNNRAVLETHQMAPGIYTLIIRDESVIQFVKR